MSSAEEREEPLACRRTNGCFKSRGEKIKKQKKRINKTCPNHKIVPCSSLVLLSRRSFTRHAAPSRRRYYFHATRFRECCRFYFLSPNGFARKSARTSTSRSDPTRFHATYILSFDNTTCYVFLLSRFIIPEGRLQAFQPTRCDPEVFSSRARARVLTTDLQFEL